MDLGAFSISLSVKNIEASAAFYGRLGFTAAGGNASENWLILRNGAHVIGLFQGMFDRNMLTFNPGWDQSGGNAETFTDIRALRQKLEADGLEIAQQPDEPGSGPASFVITDPDGNPVLIDQHR